MWAPLWFQGPLKVRFPSHYGRENQSKKDSCPTRTPRCVYLFTVIGILCHQCTHSSMLLQVFYPYCNELWIAYSYNVWLNLLLAFLHFYREKTILRLIWICIDSVTYPVKGLKHFKTDWSLVFWMLAWRYRYAIFNQDIFYKRVDFCVLKSI